MSEPLRCGNASCGHLAIDHASSFPGEPHPCVMYGCSCADFVRPSLPLSGLPFALPPEVPPILAGAAALTSLGKHLLDLIGSRRQQARATPRKTLRRKP